MQETALSKSGFVVEWQLPEEADRLIDLSAAESQVRAEPATTMPSYMETTVTIPR